MGIDIKAFSIIHRSAVALLKRYSMMYLLPFALPMMIVSCEEAVEHTAPAIYDRDSVALMISYGVNTLISDSGVMKYRIVKIYTTMKMEQILILIITMIMEMVII